jgi:hypothetical protein
MMIILAQFPRTRFPSVMQSESGALDNPPDPARA